MKSRKIAFSRKDKTTDEQKSCTSELIILNQAKIFGGVGIIGARWRMRLIWPEVRRNIAEPEAWGEFCRRRISQRTFLLAALKSG